MDEAKHGQLGYREKKAGQLGSRDVISLIFYFCLPRARPIRSCELGAQRLPGIAVLCFLFCKRRLSKSQGLLCTFPVVGKEDVFTLAYMVTMSCRNNWMSITASPLPGRQHQRGPSQLFLSFISLPRFVLSHDMNRRLLCRFPFKATAYIRFVLQHKKCCRREISNDKHCVCLKLIWKQGPLTPKEITRAYKACNNKQLE